MPTAGSQHTSVQSASNVTPTSSQGTSVQSASNATTTGSQGTHLQSASNVPTTSYPKFSRLEDQHLFPEKLAMVKETKFICSLNLFLNLFKKCQHPDCPNVASTKHHLVGPTLVVNQTCPNGHKGKFASLKDLEEMNANNLQVAASVLLSGNNSAKIEKMANFLGLSFISDSTFYRMQRLYLIPRINELVVELAKGSTDTEFLERDIVVCGDGLCDSPGHTARNLCYFLMELASGYILEVVVRDKRHVGLA